MGPNSERRRRQKPSYWEIRVLDKVFELGMDRRYFSRAYFRLVLNAKTKTIGPHGVLPPPLRPIGKQTFIRHILKLKEKRIVRVDGSFPSSERRGPREERLTLDYGAWVREVDRLFPRQEERERTAAALRRYERYVAKRRAPRERPETELAKHREAQRIARLIRKADRDAEWKWDEKTKTLYDTRGRVVAR